MSPEELNEMTRVRPFVPFRIHMTGGATYDIINPEFISVGRTIAAVFKRRDPNDPIFDTGLWISLNHIVRIETIGAPLAQPAPAGSHQ